MAWARFDDAMREHRKTRKVLRAGGLRGLAAFGLHALGILHSSRYLTDGRLDSEFTEDVYDIGKVKPKDQPILPLILVEAHLWVPGDEDSWTVHDYLDHNPSEADVLARRQREAARKAQQRAKDSA